MKWGRPAFNRSRPQGGAAADGASQTPFHTSHFNAPTVETVGYKNFALAG